MTTLSVHRPVIALTITFILVMFGVFAYFRLGLEENPTLNLPQITIRVLYPGASARTVEEQVTRRIEDAVASLGDIKTITSTSQTNVANVTVEFREGINVDVAMSDVQQKVSGVRRDLPSDAEEPSYTKLDLNDRPILLLAVTGSGNRQADDVTNFRIADGIVRPKLEAARGVGRVEVTGGREPEVQVELLPDRLEAYGVSINDVVTAVRSQFLSTSGGEVKSGAGENTRRATLVVDSREADVSSLGALPLTTADGFRIELRHVANIYLGGAEPEQMLRVNGKPAAGLLVFKQPSANITQTVDTLLPLIEPIAAEVPAGYRLETVVDQSRPVRLSIAGVEEELVLAAAITGVILFLFLHSFLSTIIVLIAIPTSLLVAMIVMQIFGLTLNTMTLVGLVTAIGVLVDDSIVVLENIFSHLEHGADPRTAAINGRNEIGLAAIAITLVDVAVWGPVIFVSGVAGAMIRNFAIVMVAATLASLLVSFTLTPLIASRWITTAEHRSLISKLAAFWEPIYKLMEWAYRPALRWSLRHRPVILLLALAAFSINFQVLPKLGRDFMPPINEMTVTVIGELPPGTALEAATESARRWETAILDHDRFPEIHGAWIAIGRGEQDFDREARLITLTLDLGGARERTRTSGELGRAIRDVGEQVVPGMQARLGKPRIGPPGQSVQIRIFGDELGQLTRLATAAESRLAALPELADVTNSLAVTPEILVKPDARRLMDLGLSTQVVGNAVRVAYQGVDVGRWTEPDGKERDVRIRLPEELRRNSDAVAQLPLIRRGNDMLTIGQVATFTVQDQPSKINRVDRQRIATIGGAPNNVPLGDAIASVTREMNALDLPSGTRWALAGQGEEQRESFQQLGQGLALSVILMYLVLTVLYESVVYPALIITALPLATVGAFLGLFIFDQTLSVPTFIGLIALVGLVGKNSILLVDRTNDLRKQGLDRRTALEQAGPSRLRPILMTSVVLVISMLPVALQWGEGGELRAPVGAVLVGGMTTSTFLTLLYVPVAYTYFDSFQTGVGKLFRWRPFRRRRATPVVDHGQIEIPAGNGAIGSVIERAHALALRGVGNRRPRGTPTATNGHAQEPTPDVSESPTLRGIPTLPASRP